MAATIKSVISAFADLFETVHDPAFKKSFRFNEWNEQRLQPLVRTFLLGRFGEVHPEVDCSLPTRPTGRGRLDYQIGDVAVEFAVRRRGDERHAPISARVNTDELVKLMCWPGPGVLILYDFASHPISESTIRKFRTRPSLGKGKWNRSAYSVSHHFVSEGEYCRKRLNIPA